MDVRNEQGVDRATQAFLADAAQKDFSKAVDYFRHSGLLVLDDWKASAHAMRQVAAANLSLARLLEGHVNARQLIKVHAGTSLRERCLAEMDEGLLFGVWGADSDTPVSASGDTLSGAKRFASGLGQVDRAIVSAKTEDGQQLYVIDASDHRRQDGRAWNMSGMRESCSGSFDCEGLHGIRLGKPDIYCVEPHFLGGTWRIAAVTLGGVVGLLERASAELRRRKQDEAEAHLLRLSPIAGQAVSAWAAILRAGEVATGDEGAAQPEAAAVRSLAVRLLSEDIGQATISAVERSIGLSMFDEESQIGCMARDLACYMRQAARDAFSIKVGRALLMGERPLGDWLNG
ncbi:acyl-CoA/acyl-ACP dehydrogenase [Nitratireductor basaltis]|nr:acyl-CoA/acyl-ACP dehydrogenase [Nitratireductor basaltis]